MISLYQAAGRRRSWLAVGPVLLAATLATGCSAASSSPTPSSSGSARPSSASFRQCLQSHGVTLPSNRPTLGSGQPQARPAGVGSSAFRKAIQACGGGFGGGGFGGG